MNKTLKTFICALMAVLTILLVPMEYFADRIELNNSLVESEVMDEDEYNYLKDEAIDFLQQDDLSLIECRLDTPTDDLRTIRFLLNDGTEEMRIFNESIKYVDDNGQVHTKSMELFENTEPGKYRFSNRYNDISMKFGDSYSDGISVGYKNYEIELYPENETNAKAQVSSDNRSVVYNEAFSPYSSVEYIAEYSGLKEKIILEEYEGINSFSFVIATKLSMRLEDGIAKVFDENNTFVGNFGSVLVTDANQNETIGFVELEELNGVGYRLTLTVPEEYLVNDETVYPVTIDPTYYYNQYANNFAGYKQIYDVTLFSALTDYSPDAEILTVNGMPYSGYSKVLIKFPNLSTILNNIDAENLLGVYYAYNGSSNVNSSVVIRPMEVNWQTSASSLTPGEYATLFYGTLSSVQVYGTLHYGPGILNITEIAEDWMQSVYPNRGIMIESLNASGYNNFPSVDNTVSIYSRPYIQVIYQHQENYYNTTPFEGLFKLKPVDGSGLESFYAMKNSNSIVTTSVTSDVYNSDQLLYISRTSLGYTIQNPYNNYYLTSVVDTDPEECFLYFSPSFTAGSYWSFVCGGVGVYYIVGTSQEQICCSNPSYSNSNITIVNLPEGISSNQANSWMLVRQIDKIPFRIKNVSSQKYLTTAKAYDYDTYNNGVLNIFQHTLFTTTQNTNQNSVFGSQIVRPVKVGTSSRYTLNLVSSKNGRLRVLSWDSSGNAFQYNPSGNNQVTINIDSGTGYAKIRQASGSHLVLSATDGNEGSESGTGINAAGNIVFSTSNNQDLKQKWILSVDLAQFKKEAYYSQFNVCFPLPNNDYNKHINSDYGPRLLSNSENLHDGIDLRANTNTPVVSTITGKVVAVVSDLNDPNITPSSRGLYVLIRSESSNTIYEYGTTTPICMLAQHLNSVSVSLGQTVVAGQTIGYTGGSGYTMSTYSPHFHYAYCTESAFSTGQACKFVDPLFFHPDEEFYETINSNNYYLTELG